MNIRKPDGYYSYLTCEFKDSSIIRLYKVNKLYEEIEVVKGEKYLIYHGAEKMYLSHFGHELLFKCKNPIREQALIEQMQIQYSQYDSETILCQIYMLVAKLKRENFLISIRENTGYEEEPDGEEKG